MAPRCGGQLLTNIVECRCSICNKGMDKAPDMSECCGLFFCCTDETQVKKDCLGIHQDSDHSTTCKECGTSVPSNCNWCPGCRNYNGEKKTELKAVDIKPYESTVNQLTVDLLEEMLADAKSGKIQEAVVVGFLEGGDTASAYTPTVNFIRRLGAIELVKLRWMHNDILHDGQDGT